MSNTYKQKKMYKNVEQYFKIQCKIKISKWGDLVCTTIPTETNIINTIKAYASNWEKTIMTAYIENLYNVEIIYNLHHNRT